MTPRMGLVGVGGTAAAVLVLGLSVLAMPSLALPAENSPTPTPSATASPTPSPTATKPPKAPKPVPATRTKKAKNVPFYPAKSRLQGKRIVYDKSLMTIWLIDANDDVVARYPVVGRADRPPPGVYKVFSKSERSANRELKLTFNNMVRFYMSSNGVAIGFHDIPKTYDGRPIHGEDKLGLPLGIGGCVRMTTVASERVYRFAGVGTRVEVL